MALPKNIEWRGRVAYTRIEVPKDVRDAYGKSVVRESLSASNERDATRLGLRRLSELQDEWDALRKRTEITADDYKRIAAEFYSRQLERALQRASRSMRLPTLPAAISTRMSNPLSSMPSLRRKRTPRSARK